MVMAPRLELRQGQALVMTPQLQQAIKLLQLSNLELVAYVEQELERNPLLERVDADGGGDFDGADGDAPEAVPEATQGLSALELDPDKPRQADADTAIDAEIDNTFTNDGPSDQGYNSYEGLIEGRGGSATFDDDRTDFTELMSERPTLREHLADQVSLEFTDPVERAIAMHLVGLVDEAGYLREPVADIAERLGAPAAQVEAVLVRCQGFDPTGVMARDLAECLRLQLVERDRCDPVMAKLLEHLDLLAARDTAALMRVCGVDAEDVADMIREIRALNPRPGAAFEHETAQTLIPDVLVRRAPEGGWTVELNGETLPRLLVNQRYLATVGSHNKATKSYLSDCLSSANWLLRSLDQRATTILKVASEIVRQQDSFLVRGVAHLRPLNLRTIADAIGMHESTVSRVTSNKYMATPRGIFELKYFFTAAIASTDGGAAHSAEAVRHRIKSLIDGEGKAVLSDDRLVELLKEDGIDIARRTVAKYREALNIPSSVQRRRQKDLAEKG
ncbi:MAG: RNA polymerase factor sigma-54 [Alphaproteobacteria bacterium]|jgi:RNA polymerase sigma-54 factor|nr:RNA polymerase factor sigma-54 [Alphaproteobacteria bacterium]